MRYEKIRSIAQVILGVLVVYLLSQNVKYSQNLLGLFRTETSKLMQDSSLIESLEKITSSTDVSNDFKNIVLDKEQQRLIDIMNWFFNLNEYTIADKNIKNLSIDFSKKVLSTMDTMKTLKEKDISEFNESDRKFLSEHKAFLETLSKNTSAINETIREDIIIPIYTRSHIEDYIFNIGNSLSD
ncbi:MAG: hypothetical protein RR128_09590 [Clostridium sp.]